MSIPAPRLIVSQPQIVLIEGVIRPIIMPRTTIAIEDSTNFMIPPPSVSSGTQPAGRQVESLVLDFSMLIANVSSYNSQ